MCVKSSDGGGREKVVGEKRWKSKKKEGREAVRGARKKEEREKSSVVVSTDICEARKKRKCALVRR